ncbi:class I SAM-dependent DNA methyltransferase, partial [Vibrio parahaemolyticus]|nr:class I SAM-dependent DNA methyltransferase [Vibrio parahaemolyticus]
MMIRGNMPYESGHLLLNREERDHLLSIEPNSEPWIKKVLGADEFLNSKERWCLWLADASKADLDAMPQVSIRVNKVAQVRSQSGDKSVRRLAERPHQFRDLNNPEQYILVPGVSSQRRKYIPIGIFDGSVISTNKNFIIPNGTLFEFGVLTSLLHNEWMR